MQDLVDRDYFTDFEILKDPYSYFEAVRHKGPIYRDPNSGLLIVTGFDETLEVIKNVADFSSVLAPQGPAAPLPFAPEGSDITAQIEAHRTQFFGGDLVVSLDDHPHTQSRALLNRLFTPSRLKANEQFITELAETMVRDVVARGGCEMMNEIAVPFVTLVIADLLGVPSDDRQVFMDAIAAGTGAGSLNPDDLAQQNQPLVIMGMYFAGYVQDRRANPRDDILSELANATYPDGSTPDAMEVVRLTTFLFAAGQDTSAKLLGNAMRFIIDQPGLQQQLRADRSLIPALLEETLRLEGSTKMTARLARKDTRIGDLKVPAGTKLMLALSAANRDPRRWDEPEAFVLNRPRIREHLAFGRGAHVCAGAPLARAEVKAILEKLFEHTSDIDLVEARHGPKGARSFDFDPSFIIRGLAGLHLELTPAADFVGAATQPGDVPADAADAKGDGHGWSTGRTTLEDLLDEPASRELLDRHFPGVSSDPQIGMGKGMTLRAIQTFAPAQFSPEALNALDADLAKLPRR